LVTDVLIVDDTFGCREPLARFLSLSGYRTATASNGQEALAYLHAHRADVILLDLMMPEMDGIAFLQALRGDGVLRNMPVIMVTAISDGPMLSQAHSLGIRGWLVKSQFTTEELLDRVREACGNPSAGQEAVSG
jgi:CheY-like chemotaxis protein